MNKRIVKHSETHGIFLAKDFRTPPTPPSLSFKMYTKFLNFLGSKHENRTFVIFFFLARAATNFQTARLLFINFLKRIQSKNFKSFNV